MTKEKIYKGKILDFSVHHVSIEGRKVKREMVEHRGAAAMLAFDENEKILEDLKHKINHEASTGNEAIDKLNATIIEQTENYNQ